MFKASMLIEVCGLKASRILAWTVLRATKDGPCDGQRLPQPNNSYFYIVKVNVS